MKVFVYDNDLNLINYHIALKNIGATIVFSKDVSKIDSCDCLLLTGGGDICPAFYGKPQSIYENYDYLTDISEFYLIKKALKSKKRIVGICKGMQVLNVFFNGTLQNIDKPEINNHYSFGKDLFHEIITKDNKTLIVNSMHKQRIEILGENLIVEATSKDGTIEAISSTKHNLLGVQFHPERMKKDECIKFYEYAFYS